MPKQNDNPSDLHKDNQTTARFNDAMRRLLAVPKEDMTRREEEWRKVNPKKAKRKKDAA